jgi:hypothetical protein
MTISPIPPITKSATIFAKMKLKINQRKVDVSQVFQLWTIQKIVETFFKTQKYCCRKSE